MTSAGGPADTYPMRSTARSRRRALRGRGVALAAAAVVVLVAAGCGGDSGVSQAEVDEAIAEAVAALPVTVPGMGAAEVDESIRAAIEELPPPSEAVTMAEVDQAIRDAIAAAGTGAPSEAETPAAEAAAGAAEAPAKSDAAAYTRFFVEEAVALYAAGGLSAAVDYYSSPESVDGQWYVFIVSADGTVLAHPEAGLIGESLHGWVGTDINGYEFGPEMLAADEAGRWVPYVYVNPAGDALGDDAAFELKNAWVVRHDGLLFGSGWYVDTERILPALISEAAEHYREGGLGAALAFYNDPQGLATGLIPTVQYYNRTDTLDGYFAGFIAGPDGTIVEHLDPSLIGIPIVDLLGPAVRDATPDGVWITAADNPPGQGPETMRIYAVDADGAIVGGGWYRK